jgi:succinate dehydrogenase / fumarate reductase, cytochrome b subunit
MTKKTNLLNSSVGRKFLMGATGLFLCSFLVVHLSGNLLLFKNDGGIAFNAYSGFMATNLLIRIIEIGLFAGFLAHIIFGAWMWIDNRRTRPQRYEINKASDNSTLASRTTFFTGSIVFIFLVVHLNTFFIPTRVLGMEPSMYDLVAETFRNPIYDAFYVVAIALLGYHLRHGFQSAFQTFGIRSQKYLVLVNSVAVIFWLIIPLGYISMPLYFLWTHLTGVN